MAFKTELSHGRDSSVFGIFGHKKGLPGRRCNGTNTAGPLQSSRRNRQYGQRPVRIGWLGEAADAAMGLAQLPTQKPGHIQAIHKGRSLRQGLCTRQRQAAGPGALRRLGPTTGSLPDRTAFSGATRSVDRPCHYLTISLIFRQAFFEKNFHFFRTCPIGVGAARPHGMYRGCSAGTGPPISAAPEWFHRTL